MRPSTFLRAYAASLTAAALIEMFPKVTLLSVQPRRFGFSLTATLPDGIGQDAITFIEERIPVIKKRPVKVFEMMGSNAASFLRHHHQMERAKQVDKQGIAQIIQIGEFVDIYPYDVESNFKGYRILELIDHKTHIEIIGAAHESLDDTKHFAKHYKTYKQFDHTHKIQWHEGQPCYSGEQEELYFDLICRWRQWVKSNGGVLYQGPLIPKSAWSATLEVTSGGPGHEGLLDMHSPTSGKLNNAPMAAIEKGIESLGLKIVDKTFAADAYGTLWQVADKNTFYTSIERIFALMIEQKVNP
ncbi:MAG: hypothetical protein H7A40_07160 [Chlamydiales bacterium]|nr:hypothetical protein [Chlamydiales bacterium]